jgi:predicted MFS family arabinose efflux permease
MNDEPIPAIERRIVLLVAMVQFVNIVDFMMVMPMGPDFAKSLGFDVAKVGMVGGAYTASAAVAGIVAASMLDRAKRRMALAIAMVGLGAGTVLGAAATGLWSLMGARVVAGAFGGPATSVALALIADYIPPQRRGRAMGAVFGAFSAASVLGVPAGLELARLGGWRMPFLVVGIAGIAITGLVVWLLPRDDAPRTNQRATFAELWRNPNVRIALAGFFCLNLSGFALIPNMSGFLQGNMGVPRATLSSLYLVGGIASFFFLRLAGIVIDKRGSSPVAIGATCALVFVAVMLFIVEVKSIPMVILFTLFMLAMSVRAVSIQTLGTRVAAPHERAAFQSYQSATQHIAASIGAGVSSLFLSEVGGHIIGMPAVSMGAMAVALGVPTAVVMLQARLGVASTAAR